ncbi:MAG: penicillin-binding protein 2 [Deltaproteobacteria bacterium]|nr:penicillin-binding protein 2 [Deltaproteobacteria bacterium]
MSMLVRRPDVGEFRRRFRWLTLVAVLAFLVLGARLFQLQILEAADYRAIAKENIVRKVVLATTRGNIYDRKGQVLAASRPAYNVYVVPARMAEPAPGSEVVMVAAWKKLGALLGLGESQQTALQAKILALRAGGGPRAEQQILLLEDVSRDAVAVLKTHARDLPGVEVTPVSVRYYPHEQVGAHVLGYMREVDAEMLARARRSDYVEGEHIGATGVERSWESYLRGTRGWEKVLVDARGLRRQGRDEIVDEPRRIEPIPGRDLRLTIDADVQLAMDKAMRGELAGAAALLDVRSGAILGLLSKPAYDPNLLSGGSGKDVTRDSFGRMLSDPLKPAVDKTVSGAYPPGSTFKPFTALAALENGLINARIQSSCRGFLSFGRRIFRCTRSHGLTDLHKAIAQSCNVFFYRLVSEYGVTMDMIAEVGMRFGFGQKTGLGINAETSGRIPTRAWMTLRHKGQFRLGYTLNAALGQGATTVSVMQLVLAYAALANGGTLYQPQLVRAVETPGGQVVQEFSPRVRRRIKLDPYHRELVHEALVGGVNEEGGTAYRARLAGVSVAGKTGSAQVSHRMIKSEELERVWYFNRDHAWFAGYSPASSPEVAVVVLVEHGGAGGKHAAPIAFEIVRAYQEIEAARRAKGIEASGGTP